MEQKNFTFVLTLPQASVIVTALKKLPMEQVESIVQALDMQFDKQVKEEQAAADKKKAEDVSNDNHTSDTTVS